MVETPEPPLAPGGEPAELDTRADEAGRRVTIAEVVLLAAAAVVGLVSLVSLAAAHLDHHTPAVVGLGAGVLIIAAVAAVVLLDRPALRLDLGGAIPILVGLAFAAIMVFPGFEYGTGDRDPGAYVEHAVAITHTHSIEIPDDLAAAGLPGGASPGAQWAALWDKPGHVGTIVPQFYHLWPALLATAKDVGGFTGLFNTGPLLAVIAIGLAVAVARRLAGLPAAWAAAVLLPANMLEVWQSKYPTTEIFGQMLFVGMLLGMVLAVQARWRSAAAIGGVLLGLSYLERPDAIVLIVLVWVGLGALLAARRFDSRALWFTIGLVALLPYGFYQAYHVARKYTLSTDVPTFPKVFGGMVLVAVIAAVLARQRTFAAGVVAWATPRNRLIVGTAFVGLCGLLALIGGLRPRLFGRDYMMYAGHRIRSYDEISLIRLSWFFSIPGLALMMVGFGFVAWRRWRLDRWAIALFTAGLLTLYCYHLRNSPYLMWATRRFVTTVVPGIVLLMGMGTALVVIVLRRYMHVRIAAGIAAAMVAALTVFGLTQSWPLRSHNENGGSIEVEKQIAALAGNQKGVFIWQRSGACCAAPYQLFGGPLLATANQSSALLPRPGNFETAAISRYVAYAKANGRPLFYVAPSTATPPPVAGVTSSEVLELVGTLPHWEETYTSRPDKRKDYPYHLTVYRLQAG